MIDLDEVPQHKALEPEDTGTGYVIYCSCGWTKEVAKSHPTAENPERLPNAWAAAAMSRHLTLTGKWPWGDQPKGFISSL